MTICNLCGTPVDPEISLAWRKDGFAIVRCPSCGLVFRADLPTRAELADIYALAYFRDDVAAKDQQGYSDYVADGDLHRRNAVRRLRLLAKHHPSGRLLDVGCAAGFFVAEA